LQSSTFEISKKDFTHCIEHLKLHIDTKLQPYSLITSLTIFAKRSTLAEKNILRKMPLKFAKYKTLLSSLIEGGISDSACQNNQSSLLYL